MKIVLLLAFTTFFQNTSVFGQFYGYDFPPATVYLQMIDCNYITGIPTFERNQSENPFGERYVYRITEEQSALAIDIPIKICSLYSFVGKFRNGRQHGIWKTFFGNKKVVKIMNFKDGLIYGNYKVFDTNNKLLYSTTFVDGNGLYKDYYHESGIIKVEGNYKNGKRNGIWKIYDWDSGLTKIVEFDNGNPVSNPFTENENIRLKSDPEPYLFNYKIQNISGIDVFCNLYDGTKVPDTYLSFAMDEYDLINEICKPKITNDIYMGRIVESKKNGEWQLDHFNPRFNLKTEHWNLGLITGSYTVKNHEGTILYEEDFEDGNGTYKDFYYETGQLKLEGNYLNGKKEGDWKFYDENGNWMNTKNYKDGVLLKVENAH